MSSLLGDAGLVTGEPCRCRGRRPGGLRRAARHRRAARLARLAACARSSLVPASVDVKLSLRGRGHGPAAECHCPGRAGRSAGDVHGEAAQQPLHASRWRRARVEPAQAGSGLGDADGRGQEVHARAERADDPLLQRPGADAQQRPGRRQQVRRQRRAQVIRPGAGRRPVGPLLVPAQAGQPRRGQLAGEERGVHRGDQLGRRGHAEQRQCLVHLLADRQQRREPLAGPPPAGRAA